MAHPDWTLFEQDLVWDQATDAALPQNFYFGIFGSPTDAAKGYLALDAIEVLDLNANGENQHLVGAEEGGFGEPYLSTLTHGDYAANVIDRLGGIGWWGSSSHHVTGGLAFSDTTAFVNSFFQGKTLGEALLTARYPESGLIFADPLYAPAGIRILSVPEIPLYTPGQYGLSPQPSTSTVYSFSSGDSPSNQVKLLVHGFNGTKKQVHGSLQICREASVLDCFQENGWSELAIPFESGTTITSLLPINSLMDFVEDGTQPGHIILRFTVTQAESPQKKIYSYAHFYYVGY